MPELETPLHLDMYRQFRRRGLWARLGDALTALRSPDVYGMKWGDPDVVPPLQFIRDRYVLPYVRPEHIGLEIGSGGGRWTRDLVPFKVLYVVDYHQPILDELRRNVRAPNLIYIKNNGTDFPGVPARSVHYVFSFGTFVHLDVDIIEKYLANLHEILAPNANVVVQYSDKTKVMAQINQGFSEMTPERMRGLVTAAGYRVVEEDLTTLWHSSVVRFTEDAR